MKKAVPWMSLLPISTQQSEEVGTLRATVTVKFKLGTGQPRQWCCTEVSLAATGNVRRLWWRQYRHNDEQKVTIVRKTGWDSVAPSWWPSVCGSASAAQAGGWRPCPLAPLPSGSIALFSMFYASFLSTHPASEGLSASIQDGALDSETCPNRNTAWSLRPSKLNLRLKDCRYFLLQCSRQEMDPAPGINFLFLALWDPPVLRPTLSVSIFWGKAPYSVWKIPPFFPCPSAMCEYSRETVNHRPRVAPWS